MIAIEYFDLIARQPPGLTGPQGLDDGLGERRRISYEGRRHARFDAIELGVEGGRRDPQRVFLRLIGSMHGGMNPKDDLTHPLH
jgi:hypothetical protein